MFGAINYCCQNYYNQIPSDTLKNIGLSGIYSFTASLIILSVSTSINKSPNTSRVVLCTAIAMVATTIHGATTPLFNQFFDNPNNDFRGYQELIKVLFSIGATHILINQLTPFKINLINSMSIQNGNFLILCHTIIKITASIAFQLLYFPAHPKKIVLNGRNLAAPINLFDFTINPTPIYVTI